MAAWQYKGSVPVDRGWQVQTNGIKADSTNYTIFLENQDGQELYIFIHQIDAGYEMGGSYAQSARKRDWYPRSFTQARMTFTGRTASQAEYHKLVEFIRKTQDYSLRWRNESQDPTYGTVKLIMPASSRYKGHNLRGHIPKIERISERFEFAPEFQFEFVISRADAGLFHTNTSSRDIQLRKLAPWMDIFVTKSQATWQANPDDPSPDSAAPWKNGESRPH